MSPRKSRPKPLSRASAAARGLLAVAAVAGLSGCLDQTPFPLTRSAFSGAAEPGSLGAPVERTEERSQIIGDLQARRSVLAPGGTYAQIAQGVLDNSAGTAQADLRVKRLQAEARSKNWLPQIGPSVSLSKLGDVVASMVVDLVLFDNGGKRAEREFAVADVEVAAVGYADEMNSLVAQGIGHYLDAQEAREQAGLARRAEGRLAEYNRIMKLRVKGGLSDMSEARVLAQKLAEMQATAAADEGRARTALAQLQQMTSIPVEGLSGLDRVELPAAAPDSLAIKLAESERERAVAEAKMARAGILPKLGAEARIADGSSDAGLTLGVGQMLGFGTGSQLKAVEAMQDAASARVEKAKRDSAQRQVELGAKLEALSAREERGRSVTAQTGQSLDLFARQYKLGRRSLMELVSMYESFAAMERDQAALKYDIARIKLEMLRERGILVDGGRI